MVRRKRRARGRPRRAMPPARTATHPPRSMTPRLAGASSARSAMKHKGRPTTEMLARVRGLAAEGRTVAEIATDVGARPRAVKRWLAKGGEAILPSQPSATDGAPVADGNPSPPLADPSKTVEEIFGPPTAASEPTNGESSKTEPAGDPLDDVAELSPAEVVAAVDYVVGTTDSVLASIFGGPPPMGLTDGQRALCKAFSKRLSAAVNELLGGPSRMTAGETVALAFGILVLPRGVQRVGFFLRNRRAGGPVPRGSENGQDVRGGAMGAADRPQP